MGVQRRLGRGDAALVSRRGNSVDNRYFDLGRF